MNKKLLFAFLTVLLLNPIVFAHGEDKPGPNGGYIRMPGNFHTELIMVKKNELKVYLLDLQWKNPSIAKSKVTITSKKNAATCEPQSDHFVCTFPKSFDLQQKGELKVTAVRHGQSGMDVTYPLPMTFETTGQAPAMHH